MPVRAGLEEAAAFVLDFDCRSYSLLSGDTGRSVLERVGLEKLSVERKTLEITGGWVGFYWNEVEMSFLYDINVYRLSTFEIIIIFEQKKREMKIKKMGSRKSRSTFRKLGKNEARREGRG